MKYLLFLIPFCFLSADVDSGSILLYNNSPFILTATIQASDGTYLGEATIQPNQQKNFTTNLSPTQYQHPGTPDVSMTPYIVIWQCPSEGYYSMCINVAPGSLIRANDCPGLQFCNPKPKQKTSAPSSTLSTPQKGSSPSSTPQKGTTPASPSTPQKGNPPLPTPQKGKGPSSTP